MLFLSPWSTPFIFSLVFTTHKGVVVRTLITPETTETNAMLKFQTQGAMKVFTF